MPQRFNEVGLAGREAGSAAQGTINGTPGRQRDAGTSSDPYVRQYVIELPRVASAAEQALSFEMPANAVAMRGFLRVRVAEATGSTPTLNVGVAGTPAAIASALAAGATGLVPLDAVPVDVSGLTLAYQLGSADWAEFEGEVVLEVLASDV